MYPAPPTGTISTQAAQQELSAAYNGWKRGRSAVKNSPHGCSVISRQTYNTLKNSWSTPCRPGYSMGPNTSNQAASQVEENKDGIKKWMTSSVSGAGGTVDFHAMYQGQSYSGFLHHFKVV